MAHNLGVSQSKTSWLYLFSLLMRLKDGHVCAEGRSHGEKTGWLDPMTPIALPFGSPPGHSNYIMLLPILVC